MIPFIQINNQNCRTINGWIVIIVGDKLRNVKQKTRTTLITTMSSLHSALRDMNWTPGKTITLIKYICIVVQYAHILSIMIPKAPLSARLALKDVSNVRADQKRIVLVAPMAMIWPYLGNVKYVTSPKINWNVWIMVPNGMIFGMVVSVYLKILLNLIIINQASGVLNIPLNNAI